MCHVHTFFLIVCQFFCIVARHLRPEAAETMIRVSLKWRKENNVDALLYEDFDKEALQAFEIYFLEGVDKDGTPSKFN